MSSKIDKYKYQPSLIWALVSDWYKKQNPDTQYGPMDIALYIYVGGKTGAYMMHGPKLYWQHNPMIGDYFTAAAESEFSADVGRLWETIIWDRRQRKTVIVGKTLHEALETVR